MLVNPGVCPDTSEVGASAFEVTEGQQQQIEQEEQEQQQEKQRRRMIITSRRRSRIGSGTRRQTRRAGNIGSSRIRRGRGRGRAKGEIGRGWEEEDEAEEQQQRGNEEEEDAYEEDVHAAGSWKSEMESAEKKRWGR